MAQQLADWGLVSGLVFDDTKDDGTFCESCIYGKATCRLIVKAHQEEWVNRVGEIVWSDIWGPAPILTLGGWHYYIMFMDDHSRLTYLYLLRQKSGTFEAYQGFKA